MGAHHSQIMSASQAITMNNYEKKLCKKLQNLCCFYSRLQAKLSIIFLFCFE